MPAVLPPNAKGKRVTEAMLASSTAALKKNTASFNAAVRKWAKDKPKEQLALLHRALAFEGLNRVTFRTPVRDGRARASWMVAFNRADMNTAPEGTKLSAGAARAASVERGAAELTKLKRDPFVMTWISNNVNYIQFLEAGGSGRSPEGMVAVTIAELRQAFPGGAS